MTRHHHDLRERAATAVELVAATVATLAMVTTLAAVLAGQGASLGAASGEQLADTVLGRSASRSFERGWTTGGGSSPPSIHVRELRGAAPRRVAGSTWTARHQSSHRSEAGHTTSRAQVDACVLCAGIEWAHTLTSGATHEGRARHVGLDAGGSVTARAALAHARASAGAQHSMGPITVSAGGTADATIGAEAELAARLRASRSRQQLDLRAGAIAGARARAQGQVGVSLLGVAIEQSGEVEGWAGAGARGVAQLRYTQTGIAWRLGWSAALGLGGGAQWSGSIDASKVPTRHRKLARQVLHAAVRVAPPLLPRSRPRNARSHP